MMISYISEDKAARYNKDNLQHGSWEEKEVKKAFVNGSFHQQ
jgi:hypothetical protein